ncbi:MAG: DNA mismatch repair protein MutH [Alteromonadaceae bacterium]|jgi:DNA mismatch repair protein MutH
MHRPLPPKTEAELLQRSNAIAGLSLAELADRHHITMPENLKREKGWGGQLIEFTLGADAGSKPVPDFTELGIELKTLPISSTGNPLETTFVCAAPLTGITGEQWQTSHLRTKISKVLWVPILAERSIPLAERVVGTPFIWHLKGEQEEDLRQDWEELMDLIVLGDVKSITAKTGQYLQLRPKAAHAGIRTEAFDPSGKPIKSQPKGFYLKKDFTRRILADMFGI